MNGDTGNNTLIGGALTFNGGAGNDALYGHSGDFNVAESGAFSETINGGSGTDSLVISYDGISSGDFTVTYSDSTFTLNGGAITYTGIENHG